MFQFEVTEKGWGYKNLLDNQIVCVGGNASEIAALAQSAQSKINQTKSLKTFQQWASQQP